MKRLIISLLFFATVSFANIINVPADSETIQGGITLASNGDTVLVQPGTYIESTIRYHDKSIVVGSLFIITGDESYISSTIIDGDSSGHVVSFEDGEDYTSVLKGFTITNGNADEDFGYNGGGILLTNASSPTLDNLIVSNNFAGSGGGIFCGYGSSPSITNILIVDNEASDGGGLYCESSSSPSLTNVTLIGNTANKGGAIKCNEYSNPTLINVTVSGNIANNGGGLYCNQSSSPNLLNTIFWNNSPEEIYFSGGSSSNSITIAYSDIQGGQNGIDTNNNGTINWLNGNIDAEPQFCYPYNLEFTLAQNSPCVGSGEQNGSNMGAYGIGCAQPVNTIHVPADYPTIQLALNNANSGDVVLVQPGTYVESIDWPDSNGIKLISAGDESNTFLEGGGGGATLELPENYIIDTTTVITGFTIQNGYGDYAGGIHAKQANPKIENVTFLNNQGFGGALYLDSEQGASITAILRNVNFIDNEGSSANSIYFENKNHVIMENIYVSNNAPGPAFFFVLCPVDPNGFEFENVKIVNQNGGDGIRLNYCHNNAIENVIIVNKAGYDTSAFTGIKISNSNDVVLRNILITATDSLDVNVKGIIMDESTVTITNCTINQMRGNVGIAIENDALSEISVQNSNICYNTYGLDSDNSSLFLNAENNWWGHSSGPYHPTYNTAGEGDAVNLYVDVIPFLTEPDTIAPPPSIQNVSVDTFGVDYVEIIWDASAIADLAGYKVYVDSDTVDVGLDTSYTLSGLTLGQEYSVMVTCYDNGGDESWFSKELIVSPMATSIIETADTLDYGSILVGDSSEISLVVSNNGTADLNITNITSSASEFEPEIDTLVVSPSSQGSIPIMFTPTGFGLVTANLTVTSDAYNTPELVITLTGSGDLAPNPAMISVVDVPEDQGGQVRVSFARSKYDGIDSTNQIESYTVWRQIEDSNWDAVGMFNAVQDTVYNFVSPTVCDSTSEGICWSTFKTSAHTHDANVFFWSDSISGYSVDNIAPTVPTGLMASVTDEGINLIWSSNPEDDFHYFVLQKSNDLEFTTYELFNSIDTTYLDTSFVVNEANYYRIAAVDYGGNQSDYSENVEATFLNVEDELLVPTEFALHQNYPNPFNPVTTLRYDLPENSLVTITIYDMLGRVVNTLLQESQTAGYKSIIWNGTDTNGKPVSAGIYLYQIQAGDYLQTKKMVLLK
jgi:hypothetical protein